MDLELPIQQKHDSPGCQSTAKRAPGLMAKAVTCRCSATLSQPMKTRNRRSPLEIADRFTILNVVQKTEGSVVNTFADKTG